jgi:hypothetical protein
MAEHPSYRPPAPCPGLRVRCSHCDVGTVGLAQGADHRNALAKMAPDITQGRDASARGRQPRLLNNGAGSAAASTWALLLRSQHRTAQTARDPPSPAFDAQPTAEQAAPRACRLPAHNSRSHPRAQRPLRGARRSSPLSASHCPAVQRRRGADFAGSVRFVPLIEQRRVEAVPALHSFRACCWRHKP